MATVVDVELLEQKLKELDRYLRQLQKHQGVTAAELACDLDKAWIIQHGLQVCIQVVLDIGNHLLAETGVTVGEYADIFPELARLNILPADFAEEIKGMAGLRNLLVHEYAKIDLGKVADIVDNKLEDFRLFASYVVENI